MTHKQSKALMEFKVWMREAIRAAKYADEKTIKSFNLSDHILCSSLFLSFAKFEIYLKDIVTDALVRLQSKHKNACVLPGLITAAQLAYDIDHVQFKNYYATENHRAFLDALKKMIQESKFQWSDPSCTLIPKVEAIQNGISYPKPDNIASLFHRIGIEDVFAKLNETLRTDCKKLLDSINSIRVQMAHFGLPPGMTMSDIVTKLEQLCKIAESLDRITQSFVYKSK
jgi:hypothetical protein